MEKDNESLSYICKYPIVFEPKYGRQIIYYLRKIQKKVMKNVQEN